MTSTANLEKLIPTFVGSWVSTLKRKDKRNKMKNKIIIEFEDNKWAVSDIWGKHWYADRQAVETALKGFLLSLQSETERIDEFEAAYNADLAEREELELTLGDLDAARDRLDDILKNEMD
jgi:hypothetical protein